MDLKEFTKNILIDLDKAVSEAREETNRDITFSSKDNNRTVEFDIAISVESITEKSGKAGIKVLQFVESGGQISKENKNSTVSRVKFGVDFRHFTKEEERKNNIKMQNAFSKNNDLDPY